MFLSFDQKYYLQAKASLLAKAGHTDSNGRPYTADSLLQAFTGLGMTPAEHYLHYGREEGLNPNPYFNEHEYLQAKLRQVQSVFPKENWTMTQVLAAFKSAGLTPLEHYTRYGAFETDANGNFINPSNTFDANAYWSAKALELRASYPDENYSIEDILSAFAAAGLTPVSHYMASGAAEANASGIALVQTVPVSQRVSYDTLRETTGDMVPDNYNGATPPPDETGKAVLKPADVGGLAQESISPAPGIPAKNQPIPGDRGYIAPPASLVDTPESVIIPPSTSGKGKATDHWAKADPADGSAILFKQDGSSAGWLPGGSVQTDANGDLVIPDIPALAVNKGSFAASVAAEAITFSNGSIETYTVGFGIGGTHEVQRIDFTGITLLANQRLILQDGNETVVLNSTTQSYTGDRLAALATSVAFGGWTVKRDSAELTFTATSSGDKDSISISYSEPKTEIQSADFTGITLANGDAISVDGSVVYTNTSGVTQNAADIALAFAGSTLSGWTFSHTPGESTVTMTSGTANTDMTPLSITSGATNAPVPVTEEVKGGPSVSTPMAVAEDVPGTDGILAGSSLSAMDSLFGFNPLEDFIDTPNTISRLVRGGELDALDARALAAVAGTGTDKIKANEAGLFTHNGTYYLFINDGEASFDSGKDIIIKLVGLTNADADAMTVDIFA